MLVISDPDKLSLTFLATFDREHLSRLLGKLNQLAITTELGEEIAMQRPRARSALFINPAFSTWR